MDHGSNPLYISAVGRVILDRPSTTGANCLVERAVFYAQCRAGAIQMAKPTTTQQTGKLWKGIQGIGCLGAMIGITILFIGIAMGKDGGPKTAAIGMGAMLACVPIYIFGRACAWWFHG